MSEMERIVQEARREFWAQIKAGYKLTAKFPVTSSEYPEVTVFLKVELLEDGTWRWAK